MYNQCQICCCTDCDYNYAVCIRFFGNGSWADSHRYSTYTGRICPYHFFFDPKCFLCRSLVEYGDTVLALLPADGYFSFGFSGDKYKNINKTKKVKKLEKQKRRLQRSISRSYENNKQGKEYCKTKNVIKKEKLLLILNHRLTNIRHDHLHHITSEIVKREPSFICIEDLNVKGMMKNRHLSKAVQQQGFYEFRRQMEYKSKWNNIQVIIADRFFPSSKLCSCCGKIKKDLKLSERIYKCECGNVIDRDLQAALNLKKYGEDVLKRSVA